MSARALSHSEAFLLLSADDKTGTLPTYSGRHLHALTVAVILDLLTAQAITINEDGTIASTGDDTKAPVVAREFLAFVLARGEEPTVYRWLFAGIQFPDFMRRVAEGLCECGVLEHREGRFLWLFHTHRYPPCDQQPERDLVSRLRRVMEGNLGDDLYASRLLRLAAEVGILDQVVRDMKGVDEKLKAVLDADPMNQVLDTILRQSETLLGEDSAMPYFMP